MISPLTDGPMTIMDSVGSTQDVIAEALRCGGEVPGILLARDQTSGRGRLQRTWVSKPGDSLTVSFVFRAYADHPMPWLVGMAVALAAAGAVHARLQWPNDLVMGGKKVGGILSEMLQDVSGSRIPVIGLGINLNQAEFPEEIAHRATSLALQRPGAQFDAETVLQQVIQRIELLPEPTDWSVLRPLWMLLDETPGKHYTMPNGDEAVAIGIGPHGELICAVDGETQSVLAADAIFG